jgi:23S rRNA G2445 N2-methylase RlmL
MSKSSEPSNHDKLEPDQLSKIVKKQIIGAPQKAVLRVAKGFIDIAADEVAAILATGLLQSQFKPVLEVTESGLELSQIGLRDLMSLAAHVTTVREVIWVISTGRGGSVAELKHSLERTKWELIFNKGSKISLRVQARASHIFHEGKISDLVEKVLKANDILPVERDNEVMLLDVRLQNDRLTLGLSLSGRPLYMRNYKKVLRGSAPIKEDIAAAALRTALTFAKRHEIENFDSILVPFAGSGTLAFEAALAFGSIPPWVFFGPLAAEALICSPTASLRFARQRSIAKAAPYHVPPVLAVDIDIEAVSQLKTNFQGFNSTLNALGLTNIEVTSLTGDMFDMDLGRSTRIKSSTLILLNPPYGGRLGHRPETPRLYLRLASFITSLKGRIAGFILAPTLAVADRFSSSLSGFNIEQRPFNHGGKTVYLLSFCRP